VATRLRTLLLLRIFAVYFRSLSRRNGTKVSVNRIEVPAGHVPECPATAFPLFPLV
jgi:hypothetical protein